LNQFDIVIKKKTTKQGEKYEASSPLFPGCRGLATSKNEAVTKLSESVGRMVGKSVSKSIQEMLKTASCLEQSIKTEQAGEKNWRVYFGNQSGSFRSSEQAVAEFDIDLVGFSGPSSVSEVGSLRPEVAKGMGMGSLEGLISRGGFSRSISASMMDDFGFPISLN